MWFKNLSIYQFTSPFSLNAEALQEKLVLKPFQACGKLQMFSVGWVAPLASSPEMMVYSAQGYMMFCLRREDKILPSSVIKEFMQDKLEALEDKLDRKLSRKERTELKEEVTLDLLPKAFTKSSYFYAYLDPNGYLIVDTASWKKAEEITEYLRITVGSVPIQPLAVKDDVPVILKDWVSGSAPSDILILEECEMRDPEEGGGVIRCKGQPMDSDEIHKHLEAGKEFVKMALHWQERILFVLSDDFSIKRLKFEDIIKDEADASSATEQFDMDFSLMTLELSQFIKSLIALFGGTLK